MSKKQNKKIPNFFIIGAPKCGTTALSEYLKTNPEIFFSPAKEPHYFDFDMAKKAKMKLKTYLDLFSEVNPEIHKAIGEGSTGYLFSQCAIQNILQFNPKAKFIVILRNPVDFVQSWHSQKIFEGKEDILNFEEAWRAEVDRKNNQRIPFSCGEIKELFYSEWGKFGDQVERLYSLVEKNRVKIIIFDDFLACPHETYEEVLKFLEIHSDGRTFFPKFNEQKIVKWHWLQKLLAVLAFYIRKVRSATGLRLFLGTRIFPKFLLFNSGHNKRAQISEKFHSELVSYFLDDVNKLSELLGKDLSRWTLEPEILKPAKPESRPTILPKRILFFRVGSLGDNLVALPAIWAVRDNFSDADFYLLSNKLSYSKRVMGQEVFEGSGIFSGYYEYPSDLNWIAKCLWPFRMAWLWIRLSVGRFDAIIYLAPSIRSKTQIRRDHQFFSLAGIRLFFGMEGFKDFPAKVAGKSLPMISREADLLLERLKMSGLKIPPENRGRIDLNLTHKEKIELNKIIAQLPADENRTWIGIGPGSNMPAKRWPANSYRQVVQNLIEQKKIWPVILGGMEDKDIGDQLINDWKCGYNLAGRLTIRLSAKALERCALYLGNDTGIMHLAASSGIPCVALFSSRTYPGFWYPYGEHHRIFRTQVECEGCELIVCEKEKMRCLFSIQPDEVLKACQENLLKHTISR